MLIHLRIDDRLIHGQVTVAWSKHVGAQRIMVANDEVANDEIQKSLLPLAAPPGVEVTISSIEEANRYLEDNKKTFLLVKNPHDALRLIETGVEIKEINLGNMGYSEGKKTIKKSLSLSKKDISHLISLKDKNIKVYFQMLPQDRRIALDDLIR